MPESQPKIDSVIQTFKRKKVMVIQKLASLLKCSIPTVRRRLKEWCTYTSYNKNGRYYVLPDVPQFNQNGLWKYRKIFFSKYGNLRETVISLVNNSKEGLTAVEVEEIVGISSRSFLSHLRNVPQLHREKVAGRFVYFSSNRNLLLKQKQKQQEKVAGAKLTRLPTDAESVIILLERIKYPHLSIEQLSARLNKKGHRVKPEIIRNFFTHHDLLKKKDTLR